MLIKFTTSNYRSFKDTVSLDFKACVIKERAENTFPSNYGTKSMNILKSIVLVGANSAGKSNLIKSFDLMRDMVINSANQAGNPTINNIEPFMLNTETDRKPSLFECTMVINDIVYKYGFKSTHKVIQKEWLYMITKRREELIFERTKNEFNIVKKYPTELKNKFTMLSEVTKADVLYLSILALFDVEIGVEISNWFTDCIIYDDTNLHEAINYTYSLLENPKFNLLINNVIEKLDLGFTAIKKQNSASAASKANGLHINSNPAKQASVGLLSKHKKYTVGNKPVEQFWLDFMDHESSGTQKLIALLGPIFKVLTSGGTIFIDEFDSKIHPHIVTTIMDLFNSVHHNSKGGQLVVISYNQQILKKLRRDQIILFNKDAYGCSSMGALHSSNPRVRSTAFFDKEYLQGAYGGIPNIG
ncbi:MAG: AAA family ATPase [Mucilaginibacter sp.]